MEKSHVAQVAEELVKLGFTVDEADHLAREKHRAHSDLVRTAGRSPGEVAEEIAQRETEPPAGAEESAGDTAPLSGAAADDSANAGEKAQDEFSKFERSIPADK